MKAKCVICGPNFIGTCNHGSAETSVITYPINAIQAALQKEIDRLVNGVDPEFDELKKLKEQNKVMYEALDKINSLDHKHLCNAPHIAADALDIVHPIVGGE